MPWSPHRIMADSGGIAHELLMTFRPPDIAMAAEHLLRQPTGWKNPHIGQNAFHGTASQTHVDRRASWRSLGSLVLWGDGRFQRWFHTTIRAGPPSLKARIVSMCGAHRDAR